MKSLKQDNYRVTICFISIYMCLARAMQKNFVCGFETTCKTLLDFAFGWHHCLVQ